MAACLLASGAVFGCSDDSVGPLRESAPETKAETALAERKWIDSTDATRPEVWLVSRITRTSVDVNDPEHVARMAMILDAAAHQFREPPRMIANRAVQLEGMLASLQENEQAHELIEVLTDVVDGVSAAEGFAAVCQHYYNLRSSGLSRDAALSDLKRRYGARR